MIHCIIQDEEDWDMWDGSEWDEDDLIEEDD